MCASCREKQREIDRLYDTLDAIAELQKLMVVRVADVEPEIPYASVGCGWNDTEELQ